ncbi:MAG: FxsA family protein [Actinomycetes bacterium]
MGGLALLVFLVLPVAEIVVAIQVADAIGGFATALLLLITSVIGGVVVRRAGARAWAALQEAAAAGRPPRNVLDGAIVLLGGLLLLVPGFITDVLGLLLLVPVTRRFTRFLVASYVTRRVRVVRSQPRPRSRRSAFDMPDDVIEGEVVAEGDSTSGRNDDRPDDPHGQIGRAG